MRALVLGCGSIGRRHARNLRDLDVQVLVSDVDESRAQAAAGELGAQACDRDTADADVDVVVVATPSVAHLDDLAWALERGAHVFVEKPLGASRADLDRALALSRQHASRRVMVGCNMRFTHGFQLLRRHLHAVGRPVALLVDFGWWLPAWRPQQDYRAGYSAQRALGGGVILDAIHEIDYTMVLAGPVADVQARWAASGALECDVEDVADITLQHGSAVQSHLHLDYLRRTYTRRCTIMGDAGTLHWDFARGHVELATEPGAPAQTLGADLDLNRDIMYVDEMRHFLDALSHDAAPCNGIGEAAATLDVALTALERGAPR